MIVEALRDIFGYVRFEVKGEFPERLLNQLSMNGVSVWGIARKGKNITACISVRDYLKMRQYRGKNKVRTRILTRHGLPFFASKHRLRVGFIAGLVMYVLVLFFMSSFVWNVRVVGNESLETEEIISACRELGLYEGADISDLDVEQIRTRLALKIDGIAWASVNIEGVRATVNISESKGGKNPEAPPCNLKASIDGVITKIEVTSGTIAVKVGQTVQKGQLLVSGITEYKDGAYQFGVSEGKVYAETSHETEIFVPFTETKTVRVGEPKHRKVLSFFGVRIPLYLGSVKGNYETDTETKRYESNEMYLPVTLTDTAFYKLKTQTVTLTQEEAKQKGIQQLENFEKSDLMNAEILAKSVEFEVQSDGVLLKAEYKCLENIAIDDLLLILE